MNVRGSFLLAVLAGMSFATAGAQSREEGWDLGAQVIYQDSQRLEFEGGSNADLDSDIGLAITFGYRMNSRFEIEFGLDWNSIDYDVNVISATPALNFSARGDLESFTPRLSLNVNLLEGPMTPYVTGGVGWSFIDTNIPDGPPQNACWWDPWYGYVCDTWQSTRTSEEVTYQLGVGIRWDMSETYTVRLGYEKHWLDVSTANGTPDFDQLKFGLIFMY
jgi:opacity protein-like surface antigen